MGFFSSRKAEDNDVYQVTVGLGRAGNDKSVVQVIRSRFYGKKGKEREDQQPPVSFLGGVSAAQTLSNNNSTCTHALPKTTSSRSILRTSNNHHHHPILSTPLKKSPNDVIQPSSLSSSPRLKDSSTPLSPLRKNKTDTVTVTLAQRLDELALANAEGLLNDDEYRLLRQNLFERFASNSVVPTEASVVPLASAQPRPKNGRQTPERPPSHNFQIDTPRHRSVDSRASTTSGATNLFRRATGQRAVPKESSDASSIWSVTSNNSSFFRLPRILSKKSSNSSIRTNTSRIQTDTVSISSRQPYTSSDRGHGESPARISRSPASIRHMATPPSSYPTRIGHDNRTTNSIYNVFDEDHLKTVQEINQEIQNVEAEAKRLMDAFNGLEVTTLAKLQRHHIRPSLKSVDFGKGNPESPWGHDSESRSQRRIVLTDDTISMRSGTSAGTTPSVSASVTLSAHSAKKATRTTKSSTLAVGFPSRSGSLHRKNSTSSISSEKKGGRSLPVHSSISHGHLKGVNSSNISLVRSTGHLPMDTVLEDEKVTVSMSDTVNSAKLEPENIENEMDDIRRRREEVSLRYQARLEYLRAKLKGAQLHEKLLRQ